MRRPRLTILRALGLGDLLTAVPALRGLARAFPGHRRLLAAPRWLEPLLPLVAEQGEPCIHALAECDGLAADPAALPGWPEVAVDLHGRGPQSHRLLLGAAPARLIAFQHPEIPESEGMPEWRADEHEVDRWCRLLNESEIPAEPDELAIEPPLSPVPDWARGATLIHPGAAAPARRWPAERWAGIAIAEREAGTAVLISGSAAERDLSERIAAVARLDRRSILAGETDLATLATHVAAADVVVCGDTGLAHLATALGTPSVVLFGPVSPAHWGPPAASSRHRVLWHGRDGDPHGEAVDPGLLQIQGDDVLAELAALRIAAVER